MLGCIRMKSSMDPAVDNSLWRGLMMQMMWIVTGQLKGKKMQHAKEGHPLNVAVRYRSCMWLQRGTCTVTCFSHRSRIIRKSAHLVKRVPEMMVTIGRWCVQENSGKEKKTSDLDMCLQRNTFTWQETHLVDRFTARGKSVPILTWNQGMSGKQGRGFTLEMKQPHDLSIEDLKLTTAYHSRPELVMKELWMTIHQRQKLFWEIYYYPFELSLLPPHKYVCRLVHITATGIWWLNFCKSIRNHQSRIDGMQEIVSKSKNLYKGVS